MGDGWALSENLRGSHAEDELLLEVKSCIHKGRKRGRILSYT